MGTQKQEEKQAFCQYPFQFNIAHRHQLMPSKCKKKKKKEKVIFLSLLKSIWLSYCFHLDKRNCSENVRHCKNDDCITIIHFSSKHFTKHRALQAQIFKPLQMEKKYCSYYSTSHRSGKNTQCIEISCNPKKIQIEGLLCGLHAIQYLAFSLLPCKSKIPHPNSKNASSKFTFIYCKIYHLIDVLFNLSLTVVVFFSSL